MKSEKSKVELEIYEHNTRKYEVDIKLRGFMRTIKDYSDRRVTLGKEAERTKKEAKAVKKLTRECLEEMQEKEKEQEKIRKEIQEIVAEVEELDREIRKVTDETTVTAKNIDKKARATKKKDEENKGLHGVVEELKQKLKDMKDANQEYIKNVNGLTALRETMARKASSANNEVRETAEEVKIKELQILDLTKKYQETEAKLDDFKSLYEEVKTGRNKYVNLIQNSSQELAQLK